MNEGKVFLIDDDPATLQLYTRALENAGFMVDSTSQVIGTVSKINTFSPDIILLDVMMPALGGDKVVKILKSSVRSQPSIILLSNKSEDELRSLSKECGADDFITKLSGPFSVVRKINEHMFKRKETGNA
jgi:DNA-binding response OmpR family regulator